MTKKTKARMLCTKRGLTKPGLNLDLKLMHQIFKTRKPVKMMLTNIISYLSDSNFTLFYYFK
jgi:hypothetical protein